MSKRIACLLCLMLLLPLVGLCEGVEIDDGIFLMVDEAPVTAPTPAPTQLPVPTDTPAPTATPAPAFSPLPWDVEVSPIKPHADGYLPNNGGYHDDSLDIVVTETRAYNSRIFAITIDLCDASQLRAGSSGSRWTSKSEDSVARMAKRFGAVLAIDGDYFAYHSEGIIYRRGEKIRERVLADRSKNYDTLFIDENGDFHIVRAMTSKEWQAYTLPFTTRIMHSYSFGPGLVIDGVVATDEEMDILADKQRNRRETRAQRIALCQTGPLQYMVIACEGPEQDGSTGLTLREFADLCASYGVQQAYNLDGGSSVWVVLNNEKLNATNKSRSICDCIWFATLDPD